jgi:hypothetical protein
MSRLRHTGNGCDFRYRFLVEPVWIYHHQVVATHVNVEALRVSMIPFHIGVEFS